MVSAGEEKKADDTDTEVGLAFFFGDGNRGAQPPLRAFPSPANMQKQTVLLFFIPRNLVFLSSRASRLYAGKT